MGTQVHHDVDTSVHDETDELASRVGNNLRRLRTKRGHSLERLAKLSGVSRAMLGQIELGRSVPTIALLWKVARALEVPFSALTSDSQQRAELYQELGKLNEQTEDMPGALKAYREGLAAAVGSPEIAASPEPVPLALPARAGKA